MLMIGGRNLAAGEGATAQVAVSIAGRVVHTFAARPGFFIERLVLPAGSLAGGDAYLPMEVTAVPLGPAPVGVSLEQFDLQPDGVPMFGALEGWQEPEYNPATGRSWRWMSDRADLWVRPVGRDVTLRLSAESPLRYFDRSAPHFGSAVAGQTIARALTVSGLHLGGDAFPPRLLTAGNEVAIVIESDRSFVRPAGGDQRNLALRVYASRSIKLTGRLLREAEQRAAGRHVDDPQGRGLHRQQAAEHRVDRGRRDRDLRRRLLMP